MLPRADQICRFYQSISGIKKGDIIETDSGEVLPVSTTDIILHHCGGRDWGFPAVRGMWFGRYSQQPDLRFRAQRYDRQARDTFIAGEFNWIAESAPQQTELLVKIRHGAKIYRSQIEWLPENRAKVQLEQPDRSGIAPGQFAVFYDDPAVWAAASSSNNTSAKAGFRQKLSRSQFRQIFAVN
ncbi:MAG: aminomethyltransferase beta-barrel domain-containing protein [Calditrichia bacterium]